MILFFFFKDYILNFINLNSEINTNIFWFNNTISSHLYIREREKTLMLMKKTWWN